MGTAVIRQRDELPFRFRVDASASAQTLDTLAADETRARADGHQPRSHSYGEGGTRPPGTPRTLTTASSPSTSFGDPDLPGLISRGRM